MQQNFTEWQALSPWSIVDFTLNTLRKIVGNAYALIPLVYTGWKSGFSVNWVTFSLISAVGAILIYAVVQWLKYRFRINNDKLEITQGLVFRRRDEIPLTRIQNVRLDQVFYYKPFGLCTLVIETAGSKKDEAKLAAVLFDAGMALKQQLLSLVHSTHVATHAITTSPEANSAVNSQTLVRRNLRQLMIFGLYENNFVWLAIIAGPVIGQFDWSGLADIATIQSTILWYETNISSNLLLMPLFWIMVITAAYLVFSIISIMAAILKYYPYQLALHEHTLQRSGGIISHQQDALSLKRVQLVHFNQPPIARLLKRWTIFFKQVQGNEVEEHTKQHMLIPSMDKNDIEQLLPKLTGLAGESQAVPQSYTPIHYTWLTRRLGIVATLTLIITLIFGLHPVSELAWFGAIFASAAMYLAYRQSGYQFDGHMVWQHTGLLGQSWKRIPFEKVQHVSLIQTPGQKKHHIATLKLGLASGIITLPYITLIDAQLIAEQALARINTDRKNWI